MNLTRFSKISWFILAFLTLFLGTILAAFSFLPFNLLKTSIDSLARDNTVESFTLELFNQVRTPASLIGWVMLLVGIVFVFNRKKSQGWIENIWHQLISGLYTAWKDFRQLTRSLGQLETNKLFLLAVVLLSSLAMINRILVINHPFRYDESYTILAFAMRPLWYAISDYHLPNNHVFHTVLVHISYQLFGTEPWAVRLPVLIAGILVVPTGYLAAKLLYDKYTALLSAALIASSWSMIDYSTNARGYMLVSLFALLILALGVYLKDNKNLAAWVLLVLFSILGMYTLLTFVYPLGIVLTWLFLSYISKDTDSSYGKSFLKYLITAGIAVVCFTILLYLPIFLTSGVEAVTDNRWVQSLSWSGFTESVPVRIRSTWRLWNHGLPSIAGFLILLGVIASLILHKRLATHRIPLILATILGLAILLSIQKVAPLAKVWLFLLPYLFIWASAGIFGLPKLIPQAKIVFPRYHLDAIFIMATMSLSIFLSWSALNTQPARTARASNIPGVIEGTALFLKSYLEPGDAVIAASPVTFPLRYYFVRHQVPLDYFYQSENVADYERVLIIVSEREDQSLESVLEKRMLGSGFDPRAAKLIHRYKTNAIYEMIRNQSTHSEQGYLQLTLQQFCGIISPT